MLTPADEDRLGPHGLRSPGPARPHVQIPVEVHDSYPLPIDRELDLFRPIAGMHGGSAAREAPDLEGVATVRGKVVDDGESPTGSDRRARNAFALRRLLRRKVGGLAGGRIRIADRGAADLARGAQVGIEQRRRHQLDVDNVVEAVALGVGLEIVGCVDLEPQKLADRALVLGTVEPLEAPDARNRVRRGGAVNPGLELGDQRGQRVATRTWHPRRWHHPHLQLPDHLLRRRRLRHRVRDVEPHQRQVAGAHLVVVANHTVPLNHRR